MDANSVKTAGDFVRFINTLLAEEEFKGSLEEYLRALWGILSTKHETKPSWALLAHSFKEAYSASVPDFDEGWMVYEHPPKLDNDKKNDFTLINQMLLYQIADLRRMKNAGTLNRSMDELWLGWNSPT